MQHTTCKSSTCIIYLISIFGSSYRKRKGWKVHIWIHDDMDKGAPAAVFDTCVIMTFYTAPMDPLSFRFYNSLCPNEYYVTSIYPLLNYR